MKVEKLEHIYVYIFPGFLHLIIMIYANSSTPLSYKSVLCDIYIEIDASGNVDISWCRMHDIYITLFGYSVAG